MAALAQSGQIENLITRFGQIVLSLIQIVGGLALLAFFWGLAKFIFKASDENGREEGKQIMKWGLVAIFVMFTLWGIIGFFQGELLGTPKVQVPAQMHTPNDVFGPNS